MTARQVNLTLALLCALACVPSATAAQGLRMPTAAILIGNGLGLASTEIALQRPTLRETNTVLGQSAPRRILLKSAGTAAEVWMVRKLGPSHPKLALGLGLAIGAVTGGAGIHNLRLLR